TCPDPQLRNGPGAVDLAQKAVDQAPAEGNYWNTLGVAHCRVEDWEPAVTALEKSMELRGGGDSVDWFFLAMAKWNLGEKEEARKSYDQAVEWMETKQPDDKELAGFRAEAAALLGVGDRPAEGERKRQKTE
ncbi:MAG: tetratricopeptide repeat protein, partial [Planctomycetota bacterium]|nr:tetratricopeptide repeat protein [Planctomycetota bacterium]